jgi:nucleotide-binding universal stress UspA family protein
MQPAWKVLAPIDLLNNPEGPVVHATNIARSIGAELTLLYVVDQRWHKGMGRPKWPANALDEACVDCDIFRLVLPGNPAETISRYAEFIKADLLAMTSENYGRWPGFRSRSVIGDVMGSTRRPVCVTDLRSVDSADADYRFHSRRILCALSLDGTDGPLVRQAEALARRSGGGLILMGVVPAIDEGLLLETVPGFSRPLSPDLAAERIQALAKEISVPYETSVTIGSPYNCIRDAAREHRADLVITARPSPGRTNANCLDMRWVLRRLPCPLLSVTGNLVSVRPITRERNAAPKLNHASVLKYQCG